MGHGKLKKFAENETFRCLLQPDASAILDKEPGSRELRLRDHAIKGNWGKEMFGNDNPIVVELGCGKGDYTIALALRNPGVNYIGVDIKGARLWKGAKYATENALPNVAFLRTRIEFIDAFFGPGEVSEIWLTFSDPQLRGSENARLSSPLFLERYRRFLKPGGTVHLKTDSRYLFEYTKAVVEVNNLPVFANGTDIYHTPVILSEAKNLPIDMDVVLQVQTFYEKMFLDMGLPITYLAFGIGHEGPYAFPGEAFDHEKWLEAEGPRRSFSHQPSKRG
ncbi:MAG: tRNA (guanosine(46)-N7)-methyltransferase TrmB [Bacteroidales bacterium]|nr:tRNA (guanosine(46)-N7)-methyltransferase TrmB [Bacteroidales bacterium]